jgi:putative ATP-dependent endonuclease of the OLD family
VRLISVRICNFQSFGRFGARLTIIELEEMTFLLGPNGSGKTAVLQALTRMFGFERSMRAIRPNDFHADLAANPTVLATEQRLWIEAHFEFPELLHGNGTFTTIPTKFAHMQLHTADGVPCVRRRSTGTSRASERT